MNAVIYARYSSDNQREESIDVRRLRDTTKLETFSQLTTLFWGLVQQ